jgi:hypothetical protein
VRREEKGKGGEPPDLSTPKQFRFVKDQKAIEEGGRGKMPFLLIKKNQG